MVIFSLRLIVEQDELSYRIRIQPYPCWIFLIVLYGNYCQAFCVKNFIPFSLFIKNNIRIDEFLISLQTWRTIIGNNGSDLSTQCGKSLEIESTEKHNDLEIECQKSLDFIGKQYAFVWATLINFSKPNIDLHNLDFDIPISWFQHRKNYNEHEIMNVGRTRARSKLGKENDWTRTCAGNVTEEEFDR